MVFPQSTASFTNIGGCHDNWGLTNEDWDKKSGIQPSAIKKMVERLIEPRDAEVDYSSRNLFDWVAYKDWYDFDFYALFILLAFRSL